MKTYTHNFIALGDSKKDSCCLAELGETCGMPPDQVIPVCLSDVPEIQIEQVPSIGSQREGEAKSIFIRLWSIASLISTSAYRKSDWANIDSLLFKKYRTEKDKADLIRIVRRQWALAIELPRYDASTWKHLLFLVYGQLQ